MLSWLKNWCWFYAAVLMAATACTSSAPEQKPYQLPRAQQLAVSGDVAALRSYLQAGGKVDERDAFERTPLQLATQAPNVEVLRLLLDAGADVHARSRYDVQAVHMAAMAGHTAALAMLLDAGATINASTLYGMTPLHLARDANTATLLLERGAELDARDIRAMTPLHYARDEVHAKVLLDRGAHIHALSKKGLTPMAMTGVDRCKGEMLLVYPGPDRVRLRGAKTQVELLIFNRSLDAIDTLMLSAQSAAALVVATPATLQKFFPMQMTSVVLDLSRTQTPQTGKFPLLIEFSSHNNTLTRCSLELDTRIGLTPEDRGTLPVGKITLRSQPKWPQYLLLLAAPIILVASVVFWRRRSER